MSIELRKRQYWGIQLMLQLMWLLDLNSQDTYLNASVSLRKDF